MNEVDKEYQEFLEVLRDSRSELNNVIFQIHCGMRDSGVWLSEEEIYSIYKLGKQST